MKNNNIIKNNALKVLILEDSLLDAELLVARLYEAGYCLDATHAENKAQFIEALGKKGFDIVLSDFSLPAFNAFSALEICQKVCPEVPFICVSGSIGEELAIDLLKKGAVDYVLKDRPERLPFAIKNALSEVKEKAARILTTSKLIESENRFRQVAETAQEWIWETDSNGLYTYASPVIKSLLGYKPDEVVRKKYFYDFFAPEKREEIKKAAFDIFSKREIFSNFENINIHKNGHLVYISTSGSPVFDDNQNFKGYRGVDANITERKLAESILRKSKNELEEYFENDISADYVSRISGEIFSCNKTFLNLFGFEKKSDTEKFDMTALYKNPENRKQLIHLIKKQGKVENYEVQFITLEGNTIHTLINAIGIFGNGNKLEKIRGYIVDITEQKNIEKELLKSEEKYRLLFANNPQPMWIYDSEKLLFLEVNQAAIHHYGYSKDEFLSMSIKDIRPANDIPLLLENIANTTANLSTASEWRHLKKNGEIINVEITSQPLIFNDRNARHILINDITNRKFFEKELIKLSRTIEQSPNSVIIIDLAGNIEYANPKTLEITGYTKEELIGKNLRIFNSGEKPEEEYKQLWSSISSGKVWFGEFHNKKKNGELYWESASISPIFNEKQEIINYVVIKEDITERKKFEDTRKLLLEISQLTTKQISLTSFLAEVHQKLKRIIRADNFYVALYNETGNKFSFPYHVDEHDKVTLSKPYDLSKCYTDYVLKSNQSLIITPENHLEVEKDGTLKSYSDKLSVWLGVPFKTEKNSEPNGVIAIQDYKNLESYTDTDKAIMEIIAFNIGSFIERINYLEELVQAKEKAEESDRLKSAFLANMSHEIRTPMNGILGFTQFLLEPDLSSEKKQKYIEIVQKSGHRMLNTVNDIVEISKIEAGIVTVSVKETDLNSRTEELIRFFKPDAEKKGLKLIFEILLPEENKNVSTDPNKFDSILSNLIKNAIKYTESGMINVGCQTKGAVVEFYVKDTGIGIPKDRQEAIFERFVQADIADTMVFEGSGLGLAIAKSYVEMLGGTIWVESKEGKGSTFYFTLPVHIYATEKIVDFNEMPIINENNKVKTETRGLKILIADDDEPSRTYVSLIVEDLSVEILEAETGIEAVELCINNKDIDLILMDIKMPGLNGYEATRRIREFNKEVIIIAQTAYALSGDLEKAIEAGCNDYIAKPISSVELSKLIRKYFNN